MLLCAVLITDNDPILECDVYGHINLRLSDERLLVVLYHFAFWYYNSSRTSSNKFSVVCCAQESYVETRYTIFNSEK